MVRKLLKQPPPQTLISVHALHAGYKAAREQRLVVFMCLDCLSVNWWSLWSLSVNAAAVAKGQTARWRRGGRVGLHRLGWGGLQERRRRNRWKKQLYTNDKHASLAASHWEDLMRSLSSFKAPEPAAMHKETQTSSFSHTHTYAHQCQSAASCWRGCNGTLCVSMPAWACQPELMIFESKCSGSEDLWEQTGENHSNMGSWCQSNQLVYY